VHTDTVTDPNPELSNAGSLGPKQWLLAALLAVTLVLSSFSTIDRYAEDEYEILFERALITFALARTLNGVISAVQGTELALQPAGVGVTLTPGEVLDPVNDLIERFSWIMLGATLSLGVQQVLLDVGQWWGIRILVAALGLLWLWAYIVASQARQPGKAGFERTLFRVFIIVLFVRFAVPVAIIANEALYRAFLESRFVESTQVIESAGAEIKEMSETSAEESDMADASLLDTFGRALDSTWESLDLNRRVNNIKDRAAGLIEHLIQLSVVFILQTGILPIAFLWVFLQLFKQLFRNQN
jgi:hypothetical protein